MPRVKVESMGHNELVNDVGSTLLSAIAGASYSVLLFTGSLTVLNTYAIMLTPQWLWHWL